MTDARKRKSPTSRRRPLPVQCIGESMAKTTWLRRAILLRLPLWSARAPTALLAFPPGKANEERKAQLATRYAQKPLIRTGSASLSPLAFSGPGKVAMLHHTIADEVVSRGMLAWSVSVPDHDRGPGARRPCGPHLLLDADRFARILCQNPGRGG